MIAVPCDDESKWETTGSMYRPKMPYHFKIEPCPHCEVEKLQKENEELRGRLENLRENSARTTGYYVDKIIKLRELLSKYKAFGTDECPECINKNGRAQIGEDYNRVTLFYNLSEHERHKTPLEKDKV